MNIKFQYYVAFSFLSHVLDIEDHYYENQAHK